jgi:hypothetical protein
MKCTLKNFFDDKNFIHCLTCRRKEVLKQHLFAALSQHAFITFDFSSTDFIYRKYRNSTFNLKLICENINSCQYFRLLKK